MSLDEELHQAVRDEDVARVRELLKKGANVNARDIYGDTPLHNAAGRGYADVARILLEHGAYVNAKDSLYGWTPLHFAAFEGHVDVVKLLLEHGADVNARNRDGWTPLHRAADMGHVDVARILLEHGADANAKSKNGWTPLHDAAFEGHVDVVKLLLEHGADPSIRDKDGNTPLDIAREKGHKEVARVIEEYKRGGEVGAVATQTRASAQQPVPASPSILGVEHSELRVGEWGRLLVKLCGSGTASLSLEGDMDWLDPGRVMLSGDAVVEVPVRPKASGEVPVRVVVKSPGGEDAKFAWLKVVDRAGRCPSCGAPVEPGAKYCWRCGARLAP
uniref:Zinc-ribbon domain-containing protein n=1 Tax=Thermofilum adornatum TaxID=1365176 RepID=A0A7C1GC84_9CREN